MKKLLLLLTILPFMISCQSPKKIQTDERLLGAWKMPMVDNNTKKILDTITVVYKNDGIVSYSSKGPFTYANGTTKDDHIWTEKYYLTNRKTMVTIDEELKKSEAEYEFITNDKLKLTFEGNIQILTKIK